MRLTPSVLLWLLAGCSCPSPPESQAEREFLESPVAAQAVEGRDDSSRRLYARGWLEISAGRFETAVDLFTCAIDSNPAWPAAHSARSVAYFKTKDKRCLADERRAFELSRDRSYLLGLYGYQKSFGLTKEAIATLEESWAIRPLHAETGWLLYLLYKETGQGGSTRALKLLECVARLGKTSWSKLAKQELERV